MPLSRRHLLILSAAALGAPASAQDADGWYPIKSDEGKPVPNLRLPVELFSEVHELPGLILVGSETPDVTIVEFYDYNCPFCRKAAKDLETLVGSDKGLRLGLVNNPVLSSQSKDAARIELAVLRLRGKQAAYDFHKRLFRLPGKIDGERALGTATGMGLDREQVGRAADVPAVRETLERQLGLAASLGFSATPSFLIGQAGVLGYPGPKSLARLIAAMRKCDEIAC